MGSPLVGTAETGFMLLLAGVSIILGIWPDLGALLYFLFLVPTAFLIHHFWTDDDPMGPRRG